MSGTFPTTTAPDAVRLRSTTPTLVSTAHSLQRQVRSRGGQRWGFGLDYHNRERATLSELIAFALAQDGQYGTFTFVAPVLSLPQSVVSGTPLVNGAHSAGATSIAIDGLALSATVMKAGEFLKSGGHAKVYMLTADLITNGSGQATASIKPSLYASLADNEALTVSSVPFKMAFASDVHEVALGNGQLFDWSCDLIEVP